MKVTASVLNVRSGPGETFRVLRQLQYGAEVEAVERSGDWAWVSPVSGWVHTAYLARSLIYAPHGLSSLMTMFGDPGDPQCSAGRVVLPAPLKLGWSKSGAEVTRVACHAKMEDIFTAVFQEIYSRGHWKLLKTFDGIYNKRLKTKSSKDWSTHSWGIAVDLNAATNRYGTAGDMPQEIIDIFVLQGFLHLKNDPMHFQYCRGY